MLLVAVGTAHEGRRTGVDEDGESLVDQSNVEVPASDLQSISCNPLGGAHSSEKTVVNRKIRCAQKGAKGVLTQPRCAVGVDHVALLSADAPQSMNTTGDGLFATTSITRSVNRSQPFP